MFDKAIMLSRAIFKLSLKDLSLNLGIRIFLLDGHREPLKERVIKH
jgi:hypothetical protein